jgi:triphosphoribosyl-dephospho-CoA synthase
VLIMDEDYVARSAQLALLLEVSAYPKPGNVDRTHDFIDTRYEHFLASSVALYPILREAAARGSSNRPGVGELIRRGVEESVAWQSGGNTHFGALLLFVPLAMAAGACERYEMEELKRRATEIMLNTSMADAIEVYTAFPRAKVKVSRDVPELDVMDEASIPEIRGRKLSFYAILTISASYDLISRELVGGFAKTFEYAALIKDFAKEERISPYRACGQTLPGFSGARAEPVMGRSPTNEAITHAYLRLLSEEEDTFIKMKFGPEKSGYVKERAQWIVKRGYQRKEMEEFDEELVREGLNPGSTADIIAAALFITILGGLRV